jgi:CRP-like cAMP-binding protein
MFMPFENKQPSEAEPRDGVAARKELLQSLRVAPIFGFLESYDAYFDLKKQNLIKGEALFEPGSNPNLYIVVSWALSVQRVNFQGDAYEIGRATAGSILWEGVIFGQDIKDTRAEVLTEKAIVAYLHLDDLAQAKIKIPKEMMGLYEHLLQLMNDRQRTSGRELLSLYDLSKHLSQILQNPLEHIFNLYLYLLRAFDLDRVVAIEQHRTLREMSILVYDSHQEEQRPSAIDSLVHIETGFDFNPLQIDDPEYTRGNILRLEGSNGLSGVLILFRNNEPLPEETWRVLQHVSSQFAGVIDKIHAIQEEQSLARKQGNYFPLA